MDFALRHPTDLIASFNSYSSPTIVLCRARDPLASPYLVAVTFFNTCSYLFTAPRAESLLIPF